MKNLATRQRAPHSPQLLNDTTLGHLHGGAAYQTIDLSKMTGDDVIDLSTIGKPTTVNVAIGNSGPVYQAREQNFYPERR